MYPNDEDFKASLNNAMKYYNTMPWISPFVMGAALGIEDEGGIPSYQVFYDGVTFIEKSPLGMKTTIGDFTSSLSLGSEIKETSIRKNYRLPNIKKVRWSMRQNQ